MSKPSRRPNRENNRENRPKKKRDRLRRQIEEIPIVVGFCDEDGNEYEFLSTRVYHT